MVINKRKKVVETLKFWYFLQGIVNFDTNLPTRSLIKVVKKADSLS